MKESLEINVKRIGNHWSAQLFDKGVLIDHMACESKQDIGWICREMLRWFDKLGGVSQWAKSARNHQNRSPSHVGRVWNVPPTPTQSNPPSRG